MKKMTFIASLAMVLLMITGCVTGSQPSARVTGEPFELVIIGTSDMHANPWGFSYEDGKETTNNGMNRLGTNFQNINQPIIGTASKQESVHIKSHFMTEIVRNKSPVTCFYKQVLIAFWYGMNLWYVGYDMKFFGYLTGFAYHKQPFFRYVGPSSCYAMLTSSF